MTAAELAERSACSIERIEQLIDLGILVPRDEDGPFSPEDVHRVRLMRAFEDAGIGLDLISKGIAKGKLSYENLGLYLPEPEALTETAEELAAEFDRSPELVARLLREFGLVPPDSGGRLRADEVLILRELLDVWAPADDDVLARLARAYGQNIRKVVASDLELAGATIFTRLRETLSDEEMPKAAGTTGMRLMGLGERLMIWLRGRHLEHEVIAVTVQTTEDYLRGLGVTLGPAPRRRSRSST